MSTSTAAVTPTTHGGHVFRIFREAMGLTLRQVAQETGLSSSHLSRIERGQSRGSSDVLDDLCHFYGTSMAHRPQRAA